MVSANAREHSGRLEWSGVASSSVGSFGRSRYTAENTEDAEKTEGTFLLSASLRPLWWDFRIGERTRLLQVAAACRRQHRGRHDASRMVEGTYENLMGVNKSVETLFSISRDALVSGFFGATRTGG